ncbi:MAG: hypothetical protein ILP02_03245 [Clostridia bacterium]|nr:hypothetical protein [Clostridia bacterium]
MKKVVSVLAVAMVTVMLCMSLAACGALSGTYSNAAIDLTFSGSTVTINPIIGKQSTCEYKVENKDGKKTITFTVKDGDDSYNGTFSLNEGSDDKGAYIEIGGALGKLYKI